jgi:hypothetical protein
MGAVSSAAVFRSTFNLGEESFDIYSTLRLIFSRLFLETMGKESGRKK